MTHAARAAQSPSPPALLLSHNPLFCLSANTLSNTTGAQCGSGLQTRGTWPCPASTYRLSGFASLQPRVTRVTRVTLHRLSHFRLSNKSTGNPSFRAADTLLHLPTSLTTLHHPSIISMINISIVQYSHYFPPQLLIAIGSTIQNLIHRTTHQPLK